MTLLPASWQFLPLTPATTCGAMGDASAEGAVSCDSNHQRSTSQPSRRTLRVLSLEDNPWFGERVRDALMAWEFDVQWCVGIADLGSGSLLQGIAADSGCGEDKTVAIDAADVDIVFADFMLIGKYSGVDVVRWFAARGVPVIAMSGDAGDNRRMINVGAILAVLKKVVSKVVLAGLPVERLARQQQPR